MFLNIVFSASSYKNSKKNLYQDNLSDLSYEKKMTLFFVLLQ
jgi:hypothetical protein